MGSVSGRGHRVIRQGRGLAVKKRAEGCGGGAGGRQEKRGERFMVRVVEIAGARHHLVLDEPKAFAAALGGFLATT